MPGQSELPALYVWQLPVVSCVSVDVHRFPTRAVIAQRGYFKDTAFINYLKYLLYWKEPEYARYLKYPMCLYFLDLLQYEHFRREIVSAQCCKFIDDQAILLWQHYTRRRTKLYTMNNGIIQMEPGSSGNPNEGGSGGPGGGGNNSSNGQKA